MPEIGITRNAREIGHKGTHRCIWVACIVCGKERWVKLKQGKPTNLKCLSCSKIGKLNYNWKGGRRIMFGGYVAIKIYPNDFFYPMADSHRYVLEHRLVVAKALGRCLLPWEIVHHKPGYRKDENKYPETLELITDKRFHFVDTQLKAYIKRLETRIKQLEARVIMLEAESVGKESLFDVVGKLSEEQQATLVKEIQDRLDLK